MRYKQLLARDSPYISATRSCHIQLLATNMNVESEVVLPTTRRARDYPFSPLCWMKRDPNVEGVNAMFGLGEIYVLINQFNSILPAPRYFLTKGSLRSTYR